MLVRGSFHTLSFQFTLSRRERLSSSYSGATSVLFQFTLSRGELHEQIQVAKQLIDISIHTLTRRATQQRILLWMSITSFQFTLSRGERLRTVISRLSLSQFQFTLSRGERQQDELKIAEYNAFQFTLSRGERQN